MSTGGEWARHWPLVIAATFGMSIGSFAIYALGQFVQPMETEFGWSRTQISAVMTLPALLMCLTSSLLGRAIGRYNLRIIAILGIVLCTGAVASFSLVSGSYRVWLALWVLYAVGAALTSAPLWVAAVAQVFEQDRSFAMTVVLCGAGLASALAPALSRSLIDNTDWRAAFRWLALIWGGTCFLLVVAFFRDERRITPNLHLPAAAARTMGLSFRQLILSAPVMRLSVAVFLAMTVIAGLMVSLAPLLVDGGIPQVTAAKVAGSLGLGVITGKLVSGRLFEHLNLTLIIGGVMGALALACILLGLTNLPIALVAAGCFALGLSSGGLMVISACLPAKLFPPGEFGIVYGWLIGVMGGASIVGPLSAGLAHDMLGSYRVILWSGVAVSVFAAVLLASAAAGPARSIQSVPE